MPKKINMQVEKQNLSFINYLWILLGCISLALGTIGIILPLLPTVPFYMLTLFCFTKGSKRLHKWFISTNLYKKHLKDFSEKGTMPLRSKITIMTTITIMMVFVLFLKEIDTTEKIVLSLAWLFHVFYFTFKIKNSK